jgi:hypothetical protein
MDSLHLYRHHPMDGRNGEPEHSMGMPMPLPPPPSFHRKQAAPTEPRLCDYLEPCSPHFVPCVVVTTHQQLGLEQQHLGKCNVVLLLARPHEQAGSGLNARCPAIAYDSGVAIGAGTIAQCVKWLLERQVKDMPTSEPRGTVSDYSLRPEPIVHVSLC